MVRASLLLAACLVGYATGDTYNLGLGRGDVTGPAAEIGMMGYAKQGQNTAGIHLRLYARAYIVEDQETGKRVCFVSVDAGMMGQLVKKYVLKKLDEVIPGIYNDANVVLSATHTHSGPAGFMQYVLFNVPNLGWIQQSMDALVDGIVMAIERAHLSVAPGKIYLSAGTVDEANINRSPTSYEANPEEEKAKYTGNTDKEMVQLNFFSEDGQALGILNWFAVHPTSMNNTNHLITGDNKGTASQMFEKDMNTGFVTGQGPFLAAFASTNLGDISPNIKGPRCMDTGLECDLEHSTCDGRTQMCVASGPGEDMYDSTWIIADRQFQVSRELFLNQEGYTELSGGVDNVHQWVDMTNYEVTLEDGSKASTCKPALGYSFAAGTTDGPGEFDFTQGVVTGNPFWDFISGLLKDPTPETEACHAPKPILLDTGEYTLPYAWHPTTVDTQILKIGQMYLLAVPGEFTTMAGRRLRESVASTLAAFGENAVPVVAGLSNTYTHYITTFEEYQKQRYEAASTIYGPHTLHAYQAQFDKLAGALVSQEEMPGGTPPDDLLDYQISFVPGIVFDQAPGGYTFGDCVEGPSSGSYGQTVSATFVSGHLRNNLLLESSFLMVEREEEDGSWTVVAVDSDWETKLHWLRTNVILGESQVTVEWEIPDTAVEGTYRIVHQGYYKHILRGLTPYHGMSDPFPVGANLGQREEAEEPINKEQNFLQDIWNLFM